MTWCFGYPNDEEREDITVLSTRQSVARKAHDCVDCHEPIEVGQNYVRITYNWPSTGGFDCIRFHCRCAPEGVLT